MALLTHARAVNKIHVTSMLSMLILVKNLYGHLRNSIHPSHPSIHKPFDPPLAIGYHAAWLQIFLKASHLTWNRPMGLRCARIVLSRSTCLSYTMNRTKMSAKEKQGRFMEFLRIKEGNCYPNFPLVLTATFHSTNT